MSVLFTAIEIPKSIQPSILELRPKKSGIAIPGALHITLHYIGKVNDHETNAIHESLLGIQGTAYTQNIKGVGVFNQSKVPHIFWAGVEKCQELMDLHHSVGVSLAAVGLELESRPYIPHITIAREKQLNKSMVQSFIDQNKNFQTSFDVSGFALFSSERSDSGAVYKKLHGYDF